MQLLGSRQQSEVTASMPEEETHEITAVTEPADDLPF
jgi:hypothetical protein